MASRWMGYLAAAALLCAPLFAAEQKAAKPALTGVAHVALRVSDVDAEIQFLGKLGYEVAFAHEDNGLRAFVFVKVNDQEFLEVHPHIPQGKTEPQPLGFNHICYVTTDANAEYAKWAAAGLNPTAAAKGPDGTLEFGAKDPAGSVTEALEILPDSQPAKDKGQHLGAKRVSDWLMGVDLPVQDLATWKTFYGKIGFAGTAKGVAIKMSSPANPAVQMVFHLASGNDQPQILFSVKSAPKAAAQLRAAGLAVEEHNSRVVVHDPDGNAFVFVQSAIPPAHK